jgi:hypothetical protein
LYRVHETGISAMIEQGLDGGKLEWMKEVTEAFQAISGLHLAWRPAGKGAGPHPDGKIRITRGRNHWDFLLLEKGLVDRIATLHKAKERLDGLRGDGILLTPYLTPDLAQKCQELGIPFLDAAGNAFLDAEGLFVLVTGRKPEKPLLRSGQRLAAFGRTGLRVVFTLLAAPVLMEATYRDIAKAAGVALGTVGRILADLQEHRFITVDREGKRRWIDRPRAIEAWNLNYPLRLREKLNLRRFRAKDEDWWQGATPETFGGCWGGEVAAAKLLGDLVPKTVTLYLPGERTGFLAANRLRADPQGPIEVLDAFWAFPPDPQLPAAMAPPLLVYADLQRIGDPRTFEQARMIHDRYLA